MEGWKGGRVEGWKRDGRGMEEGMIGRLEEGGRGEGWKGEGKMEGWKRGGVEGWKRGCGCIKKHNQG